MSKTKKKKSKLTFDGFYMNGEEYFHLYKNEKGNIIRKKQKKVNVC